MAEGNNRANGVNGSSKLEKIANNVVAIVIARFVIPVIGIIAVSAGTFAFNRVNESITRFENFQHQQVKANELLQQQIDFRGKARDAQITTIDNRLGDHETRIRGLERRPK